MNPDPPDESTRQLLNLSDQTYATLLGALQITFALGDRAGGLLVEQSRRAMFNLHETNHLLAARGVRPRFALPATFAEAEPVDPAALVVDLAESLRSAVHDVTTADAGAESELALRQTSDHENLLHQMQRLAGEVTKN
jgi:hypothetical protein